MSKIMIVDDSRFTRVRLARLLTRHGHEVIEAEDGVEAVQTYRLVKPDAVLMDFAMPGKNGIVALTEIRQFDPQAKVIFLTALDQPALALKAAQLGAKDFLTKLCDSDQLLETLRKVLGRS